MIIDANAQHVSGLLQAFGEVNISRGGPQDSARVIVGENDRVGGCFQGDLEDQLGFDHRSGRSALGDSAPAQAFLVGV